MTKLFQLNLDLSYDLETGYTSYVKSRELITQYAVKLNLIIRNDSKEDFPGTILHTTVVEHGSSVGQGLHFIRGEGVNVPRIETGKEITLLVGPEYTPLLPGLLELRLDFSEPEGIEIQITRGEGRPTFRKSTRYPFNVIDWHELEKIKLLKGMRKSGKNG